MNKIKSNCKTSVPYQTCPLCKGSGKIIADGFINTVYQPCKVCNGKMVIPQYIIDIHFNENDLEKITGYLLYDLFELGILNEKGIDFIFKEELSDEIIKEVGNTITIAITEKKEHGAVL